MKPLELVVRAFGPYAAEQVFDFGELGGRTFFLIHGPTGAGKTTVLDAMCFALYGTTSGAERDARRLRSDHAAPQVVTEVVFDFTLGADRYRVERRPEQERPYKRGKGTTTERAHAVIWKIDRAGGPDAVLADKWSTVTAEVVSLMGFEADQFRQVVMLPQGQFRRLLMADSGEREVILEKLFGTELYRRIEDALKEAKSELAKKYDVLGARRGLLLENAGVSDADELERGLAESVECLTKATEQVGSLRAGEKKLRKELAAAESDILKLHERDRAEAALQAITADAAIFEDKRESLTVARRALPLETERQALLDRRGDCEKAVGRCGKAEEALAEAAEHLEGARLAFEAEDKRTPERKMAETELVRLRGLTDKVGDLQSLSEKRDDSDSAKRTAGKAREGCTAEVQRLTRESEAAARELEAVRALAVKKEPRAAALVEATRLRDGRKQLDELTVRRTQEKAKHEALEQRVRESAQALMGVRADLEAARDAWGQGQAAVLASALESGEPCPVCGSTEHPAPAPSAAGLPAHGDIEAREKLCRETEAKLEESRNEERERARRLAEIETEAKTLRAQLEEAADVEAADLETACEDARNAVEEAMRAEETMPVSEQNVEQFGGELRTARDAEENARAQCEVCESSCTRAATVLEEAEKLVPEKLRAPGELGAAIDECEAGVAALGTALKRAREAAAGAEKRHAADARALEEARKAETESREAAEGHAARFAAALGKAGFAAEAALAAARMAEAEIDALEAEIKRFDGSLAAARGLAERAAEAAKGLSLPDLEPIRAALAAAEASLEDSIAKQATLSDDVKRKKETRETLAEVGEELGESEKRYAVVGRLADVATGKNAPGIPFQRFVLAALLDDVLAASSECLRIMSNGRYTLERSRDRESRRKTAGLELAVYDAYTGLERPVATLSGGESFLASLSLALGLADVVQAYSGGIHLDTIIVDEGFGTLDPEALDLALRALLDLQKGGRLVGIISHVPELRERIQTRLEITTGREGSEARFVID